jgi:DNA-binding transcriptional regulator YhcF (GntR family)
MVYSIRLMTVAEERARQARRKRFSVKQLADYLGVNPLTVRAAIRRLSVQATSHMTRGQAAKVMLHIRERQGEQILNDATPKRKVTFLG